MPSVFVRASGCNLRCWFCDTPYTSWEPEGEDLSLDEILRQVDELLIDDRTCGHAVLTGGTLYLPLACDLMSISPKLAGSGPTADQDRRWHKRHEKSRHMPEVIHRLVAEYPYQ